MKKSKEYKISIVLFSVSLILFGLSVAIDLFGGDRTSMDKVCLYLGYSFLCFGFVLLGKAKRSNDNKDN